MWTGGYRAVHHLGYRARPGRGARIGRLLIGYGAFRFTEFFRERMPAFSASPPRSPGPVVSLPICLIGVALVLAATGASPNYGLRLSPTTGIPHDTPFKVLGTSKSPSGPSGKAAHAVGREIRPRITSTFVSERETSMRTSGAMGSGPFKVEVDRDAAARPGKKPASIATPPQTTSACG